MAKLLLIAFALMAIVALTLASPRPEPILGSGVAEAAGAATGALGLGAGLSLGVGAQAQGAAQAAGAAQGGLLGAGVPVIG